ncbi:MAG: TonB-dependent receptor, partial [Bacteroidetes bacterium]
MPNFHAEVGLFCLPCEDRIMKVLSKKRFLILKKLVTIWLIMIAVHSIRLENLFSQEHLSDDTTKTYRYGEVVIRAERLYNQSSTSVQRITREDIETSSALFVSDLISHHQGIFIKNYGGASGIKTISQRGLGSEHSVVLLNGMRISSQQNGLLDFSMFPLEQIERLEILQGGLSSVIGADAVGGAINLITLH